MTLELGNSTIKKLANLVWGRILFLANFSLCPYMVERKR
jgi:hypothetical protein